MMSPRNLDPKKIQKDWNSRGFSCDLWVDPPGQVWQDFVHTTEELVMPLEGELEFIVADEVFRPEVGEELHIPAHVKHTVRNLGSQTAKWLYGYRGNTD